MRTTPILAVMFLLAACSNKLEGSLQLDGAQYLATSCNSGVTSGFVGIELQDHEGRKVRAIKDQATGGIRVVIVPAASYKGEDLGFCATLDQHMQNSEVNRVQNEEGTVTFNCDSAGHKLSGTLKFANCH